MHSCLFSWAPGVWAHLLPQVQFSLYLYVNVIRDVVFTVSNIHIKESLKAHIIIWWWRILPLILTQPYRMKDERMYSFTPYKCGVHEASKEKNFLLYKAIAQNIQSKCCCRRCRCTCNMNEIGWMDLTLCHQLPWAHVDVIQDNIKRPKMKILS